MNTTILYVTSNQENPEFEEKIQQNLLKVCGNLPIISISQKPMDLGTNICVGKVGVSGFNMFRQVLIGCEAATTPFVISAEADCLYPPDYFTFVPPREDIPYRNKNIYLIGYKRDYFYHKPGGSTFSQIVGREFYIKRLKELFGDGPMWSTTEKSFPKERHHKEDVFKEVEFWESENPCISMKTGRGMRKFSTSDRVPVYELPYWGSGKEIAKNYL